MAKARKVRAAPQKGGVRGSRANAGHTARGATISKAPQKGGVSGLAKVSAYLKSNMAKRSAAARAASH